MFAMSILCTSMHRCRGARRTSVPYGIFAYAGVHLCVERKIRIDIVDRAEALGIIPCSLEAIMKAKASGAHLRPSTTLACAGRVSISSRVPF